MSTGALYRKYRSKTFKDVIGQEHITNTLINSIKNNSFAHAYLLTGPRGVGKTSVARLFACEVNGIEYKDDETFSDIIEIDAASNRRIDEIRELREKVNIVPSMLKYKVYIIDEVHMLTREAFNALLKTLEEPPAHVIFILATTDFHKVPDTIVSRCVRFSFLSIPRSSIKKHLEAIAKQESISIEEEALEIIADNSDGSFRDAISLLDQFRNSKDSINADYVSKILGIGPAKEIAGLVGHIEASDPKKIIQSLDRLREGGSTDAQIIKQLSGYLRRCLLGEQESSLSRTETVNIMESLLKAGDYHDVHLALEVTLIGFCAENGPKPGPGVSAPTQDKPQKDAKGTKEEKTKDVTGQAEPAAAGILDAGLWESVLEALKNNNNTLYAIARMAEVKLSDDALEIYFKFPFHYKQMSLEKNYMQIEKTVKSLDKKVVKVSLFVQGDSTLESAQKPKKQPEAAREPVKNISNIFGPSEVLES